MKNITGHLLTMVILLTAVLFINNTFAQSIAGYKLVWAEEFNNDGVPNPANWSYEKGFVRNEEDQWYQPQNAHCKNGYLIIEARREVKPNLTYIKGSKDWGKKRKNIQYTSACIITEHKRQWQYGRFVMRGKIDVSEGSWPAWWTLGTKKI